MLFLLKYWVLFICHLVLSLPGLLQSHLQAFPCSHKGEKKGLGVGVFWGFF